ncbi:sigma-54 interaction domain-containing protein [Alicyclobacillus contaminans]|uniref:sigma-54 interaction domain-containing protein n=1 Tax=Alicyclobacillus contaminans TaxID=392016 RepID=UPI000478FB87|nr:sigma-54-dependent Fis family transcriptional regulator [Alicyclobacillus contaminans]
MDREDAMELLEAVLDKLDEGIHVVDSLGRTIYYNEKMADMEAMRKEDVMGKNIQDVFTFSDGGGSTLVQAIREGRATENVKQTYFNNRGMPITTVNHTYPIRRGGRLLGAVEIARDITREERLQANMLKAPTTPHTFETILSSSPSMAEVIEHARRAARTQSSVLIVGETGTGKELVAQSLHHASSRSLGPFISQNCAALPESLIEGLLFGTVRGAFTGAVDRPGLMEQAHGGTLLLDELNSLSPPLQAKLLRVLQERVVRRVGDVQDRAVDVRIIATMNEDPLDAVAAGRLRKDLYYRLSVVTLFLPPLRERMADIPHLVEVFIEKYNRLFHLQVEGLQASVMDRFMHYSWPGNVRELEHTIEGAMNLIQDETMIGLHHLPLHLRRKLEWAVGGEPADSRGEQGATNSLDAQLEQYERAYLEQVLHRHRGNVSAAARELGMSRQNLQYRLRKFGLTRRR